MRKFYNYILVFFLITTLFACKKNKDAATSIDIIGKWKLAETTAYIIPVPVYTTGDDYLVIATDSTYAYYASAYLIKSGKYTIMNDATVAQNVCLTIPDGQFTRRIVFDNMYSRAKVFVDVRDGKLSFISGCYGSDAGYKSVYRCIHNIDGVEN